MSHFFQWDIGWMNHHDPLMTNGDEFLFLDQNNFIFYIN